MHRRRTLQFTVLALVSLLASALPSFAWACSAAHCVGADKATHITVERCHDEECLRSDAKCCKPLQCPPDTGTSQSPAQKQVSAGSLLFSLARFATAGNLLAVLPEAPPVVKTLFPPFIDSDGASFFLVQDKSPPLPGRSPPLS